MPPFADINFPLSLSQKAVVRPEFSTRIIALRSGQERRATQWNDARLSFDVGPALGSMSEIHALIAFFRARRGAAQSFRFRDPTDFSSHMMMGAPTAMDQILGIGDGETSRFALLKTYGDAAHGQQRRIVRPVTGSVLLSVNEQASAGWQLQAGGFIQFNAPPANGAQIRAGFLFDVEVRFAEDALELAGATHGAMEMPSVPLIEVKGAL